MYMYNNKNRKFLHSPPPSLTLTPNPPSLLTEQRGMGLVDQVQKCISFRKGTIWDFSSMLSFFFAWMDSPFCVECNGESFKRKE